MLYGGVEKVKNLSDIHSRSEARAALGIAAGSHTVTAAEGIDTEAFIATGLSSIDIQLIDILRSGNNVNTDVDVTVDDTNVGYLWITNGSTYTLTTGDVIRWIAIGFR